MMIEPPTGSPARSRLRWPQKNQDQGIGEEAQKAIRERSETPLPGCWAVETQPLFRLVGSQSGRRCLDQAKQVRQGHIPEAVQLLVRFFMHHLFLEFYML